MYLYAEAIDIYFKMHPELFNLDYNSPYYHVKHKEILNTIDNHMDIIKELSTKH